MVTDTNVAPVRPAAPSRLPEMLAEARTPLGVLCALAEDGLACDFDLWAMASVRAGAPAVNLCTTAPLAPATAATHLAHFISAAAVMDCEGDLLMPDWSAASQQVACLRPTLPPLEQELLAYRDLHVSTDEQTGVIIRAAMGAIVGVMVLGLLYYVTGKLAQSVAPGAMVPTSLSMRLLYAWQAVMMNLGQLAGCCSSILGDGRLGRVWGMFLLGAAAGAGVYLMRHTRWTLERLRVRRNRRRRRIQ